MPGPRGSTLITQNELSKEQHLGAFWSCSLPMGPNRIAIECVFAPVALQDGLQPGVVGRHLACGQRARCHAAAHRLASAQIRLRQHPS